MKLISILLLLCSGNLYAQELRVYGHIAGSNTPQQLSLEQVQNIKTTTHGEIQSWLALATHLDTNSPQIHLIDTEYFSSLPTQYGIHQAYAKAMGIVSSAREFIRKMTGQAGTPRSIMALNIYLPNQSLNGISGNSARWILQNRRYVFRDKASSLASSLDRIQKAVRESFPLVTGKPLLITYSKQNSTRRPNRLTVQGRADIKALANLGLDTLTESEMASQAGQAIPNITVHNPIVDNSAFGYLKLIESEQDLLELTPQHIAIFPELPDRVPPVAAILTLEAQTDLSHINVLAINRGTLNIAVNQEANEQIAAILSVVRSNANTPFQIQVINGQVSLKPTSVQSVASFYQSQKDKIGTVIIPEVNLSTGLGVIKPTSIHTTNEIGAKAANYGKLERLLGNQFVRPGFAIGFKLYRTIVTAGSPGDSIEERLIKPLVAKVQAGSITPAQTNEQLSLIRSEIGNASVPQQTLDSLVELVTSGEYKNIDKIRFRSSTNCEDLPRFNGAGLYLSEGIKTKHVRKAKFSRKAGEKLRQDLMLVLGSLWLPRAFWEREYFSIDHSKAALAIQINPSFVNEFANGVIIASKVEENASYWINSQYGEASVTNPLENEIPESLKFSSEAFNQDQLLEDIAQERPVLMSTSNISPIFVQSHGPMMTDRLELFTELLLNTRIVLETLVQDTAQFGIDIEFKIIQEKGGLKLYLKQARPINLGFNH